MLWVACAEILNKTIHMSKPEIMGYLFKDNNVPIEDVLFSSIDITKEYDN